MKKNRKGSDFRNAHVGKSRQELETYLKVINSNASPTAPTVDALDKSDNSSIEEQEPKKAGPKSRQSTLTKIEGFLKKYSNTFNILLIGIVIPIVIVFFTMYGDISVSKTRLANTEKQVDKMIEKYDGYETKINDVKTDVEVLKVLLNVKKYLEELKTKLNNKPEEPPQN